MNKTKILEIAHALDLGSIDDKKARTLLLGLLGVSNWVSIESEEQPERVTEVRVKCRDGRKEVAFFHDGRFYRNYDDDITDKIVSWHKLP